jgi:hypothetical protein
MFGRVRRTNAIRVILCFLLPQTLLRHIDMSVDLPHLVKAEPVDVLAHYLLQGSTRHALD